MTAQLARHFPIVVALDDSEYSEIVLEHALDQAARHLSAVVHFIRVVKRESELDDALAKLTSLVREGVETFALATEDYPCRLHVRAGHPAVEVVNLAHEVKARLLVIGRYGTHRRSRSLADEVIAGAPCSTLIVGLSGDIAEAAPQCPSCVEVRERSEGETWFCAAHAAPDRMRLSSLLPGVTHDSRGGVW
jgi:nucleotide-binding universal stress UspA family protein